ncbi:MAG: HEAT repeat domain-containing protein [Planctomycetota bacterium]
MSRQPLSRHWCKIRSRIFLILLATFCIAETGCQDGPLYALKVANPYFSWSQWGADEKIGVTDHQRRKQLTVLAETAGELPPEKQAFWAEQMEKLIETDQSPEMRRLAVRAASRMDVPTALEMIEKGLDDASLKVRMEACQALGRREGEDASRLLVATIGTDTDVDVKHAALEALAKQDNAIARDALRVALADRNPATRHLAIESLREVTGLDYGEDPKVWIAALDGLDVEEASPGFTERLRGLF